MSFAAQLDRIVREDGPWTAHWFLLPDGTQTVPNRSDWEQARVDFFLRQARIILGHQLGHQRPLRALDLGCLEGGIAIRLAQAGCEVVAIEVRESSLRKARFVADALGVDVRFVQGDMLDPAVYADLGQFDLIVCAGTLYHVDAPDLAPFLAQLNRSCRGVAIFDTHVAMDCRETYSIVDGPALRGRSIVEHFPSADKESALWASATNAHSFWPTERSLANALVHAGWAQVFRPLTPTIEWEWQDRGFWIACSATMARERSGEAPTSAAYLPDPDPRPVLSGLMSNPVFTSIPNPATTPTSV